MTEDLHRMYRDPTGPRGEVRDTLTDNQKTVLWSLYAWEVHNNAHTREYRTMRPKAKARALYGVWEKGMVTDAMWLTDKGRSYARQFRKC